VHFKFCRVANWARSRLSCDLAGCLAPAWWRSTRRTRSHTIAPTTRTNTTWVSYHDPRSPDTTRSHDPPVTWYYEFTWPRSPDTIGVEVKVQLKWPFDVVLNLRLESLHWKSHYYTLYHVLVNHTYFSVKGSVFSSAFYIFFRNSNYWRLRIVVHGLRLGNTFEIYVNHWFLNVL